MIALGCLDMLTESSKQTWRTKKARNSAMATLKVKVLISLSSKKRDIVHFVHLVYFNRFSTFERSKRT